MQRPEGTTSGSTIGELAATLFDRAVHFDGLTSPIAEDPGAYLAPWHASSAVRRLSEPRGRTGGRNGRPTNTDTRVLVTTRKNANFLPELRAHLDGLPDCEQRFLDLADFPKLNKYAGNLEQLVEQMLGDGDELSAILRRRVAPHLEWADVVWVEWCLPQAVYMTLLDPADRRVIVRLHSQELFTVWPHLVDFSRVDDVVFVSEHLRDLALDVVPALKGEHAPRLHVLPNALRLEPFRRPKPDDARFNFALVGWGHVAKDPMWALEVARRLRVHDERYTLHLIGGDFRRDFSAAADEYGARMQPVLDEHEALGAVRRHGHTDDVAGVLQDVGTILSTSVRESFHAAVMEGAASGAVPVVRDWPFFAGKPNGARTLFPPGWVVASPEEAAERILTMTADDATWRSAGDAASRHSLATWDWEVVKHRYDELFRP